MRKAIIYTRAKVNLSDCDLTSIAAQIQAGTKFAEQNGLQLGGVYTDIVAIGTNCNFITWRAIVNDRKPDYDYIIINDYARMGRNTEQVIKDRAKLKSKGIRIVSVTENMSDECENALFDCLSEFLNKEAKKC